MSVKPGARRTLARIGCLLYFALLPLGAFAVLDSISPHQKVAGNGEPQPLPWWQGSLLVSGFALALTCAVAVPVTIWVRRREKRRDEAQRRARSSSEPPPP
jgi:ABC-type Fe3+ transport system permease subunit